MGKPSGLLVASYLFLILSVAPLDARRIDAVKANIATDLVAEADADWGYHRATPAQQCAAYQQQFELRTQQVQQLSTQLRSGGGTFKQARTLMQLRSMARVYERAATQQCNWVAQKGANTTALRATVEENLMDNACFPQAQALMLTQWNTTQEQVRAMSMATQFLTTGECTDEDARRIAEEMDASAADPAEEVDPQAQLAALAEDSDTEIDDAVEALTDSDSSFLQVAEGVQFQAILSELVGLVAFLLIWAVLCVIFIPVILMVIGAVLCTLAWVVRRFLGRSNSNLGSCMNWWARQTQTMFEPGNELITAGACLIAGWFGAIPNMNIHANFPALGIYIRR